MAIKGNTPGSEIIPDKEEPGAVDNRLSLVPSDFPVIEDWADGEEYDLSDLGSDTKLRQISPGEFEVIPGAATRKQAVDEEASPTPKRTGRGYRNPAVEAMADE